MEMVTQSGMLKLRVEAVASNFGIHWGTIHHLSFLLACGGSTGFIFIKPLDLQRERHVG
jgi:hypothetical protein